MVHLASTSKFRRGEAQAHDVLPCDVVANQASGPWWTSSRTSQPISQPNEPGGPDPPIFGTRKGPSDGRFGSIRPIEPAFLPVRSGRSPSSTPRRAMRQRESDARRC